MRSLVMVLLIDMALVAALILVSQDLAWRSAFAASDHGACALSCAYTPSSSYGVLTRVFTMSGNQATLSSPQTLDWVQVLAYALIAVNGWFGYEIYRSLRSRAGSSALPSGP